MPDNQMDFLITQAQQNLAEKGAEASDRDAILACFGWLGQKFANLPCLTDCPQPKNGNGPKRWLYLGIGIGLGLAGAGGAGAGIVKALGL